MLLCEEFSFVFLSIFIVGRTGLSYNRPHLCENAAWNVNGTTFKEIDVDCGLRRSVFVDDDDNVYSLCNDNHTLSVWWNGDYRNLSTISTDNIANLSSIFVSAEREVFFETTKAAGYIVKQFPNSSNETFVANFSGHCTGLFIDLNNTLYCSMYEKHKVDIVSLNGTGNTISTRAGDGTSGFNSTQLNNPWGIFVDTNFNLYVADSDNHRIQRFANGQSDGITVAGNFTPNHLNLSYPGGVVLDAFDCLYIADSSNNRIIRVTTTNYSCLVGCSGIVSAAHQLNSAYSLRFDSHGNLYVADEFNRRIQKFFLTYNCKQHSFNRPTLCSNATWNHTALTVVSNTTVQDTQTRGIFIDLNNTFYFANYQENHTLIWPKGNFSQNFTSLPSISLHAYSGLFIDTINDIYFANNVGGARVIRRSLNNSNVDNITRLSGLCYGIFIDVNDTLYCSLRDQHLVDVAFLQNTSSTPMTRAGNGTNGSAINQLSRPWGIFVDINFNLYVADFDNHRIQRFRPNEYDAMTVAGRGIPNGLMLQRPTDVIVDGHNHLYIADNRNHRIIRVTGNDYQCLAGGCLYGQGSSSYQLSQPYSLRFDSYGNLFVADESNRRIQAFLLLSDCGQVPVEPLPTECSITTDASTMTSTVDVSQIFPINVTTTSTITSTRFTSLSWTVRSTLSSTIFTSVSVTTEQITTKSSTVSNNPCSILNPCLNQGVCSIASNNSHGYICSCQNGFSGTGCQFDQRICRSDTCRNQGSCQVLSNGTFLCLCASEWSGHRCEKRVDFCRNTTCQNRGVCRNLFMGYKCECLGASYSGHHCEIESDATKVLRRFALSMAYIAIIVIISTALLIVFMDVLKYVFKIETVKKDSLQKNMLKKKRRTITIVHYVYKNASHHHELKRSFKTHIDFQRTTN